jgi:dTDP-4-dehydrorhamnose reductase
MERGLGIDVAEDIYSMPLFAPNCAEAIWAAVRLERRGIYHLAGADRVTLVEFARHAARVFGLDERLVIPVPSATFTSLAPRPRDTCFVTSRMQHDLRVRPIGVREGLMQMLRTRVAAQ